MSTGDNIKQLPIDEQIPSQNEINIVNTIFKKEKTTMDKVFGEFNTILFVGVLFLIFSLPIVDDTIKRFIPMTQSSFIILLLLKVFAFMVVFWIVNNFYLAKKRN
jgi:hypothetical protein